MTARPAPRARRLRPLQVWLLAVLLLAAQALGLAHRVAHAPGLPGVAVAQATALAHVSAAATAASLEAALEAAPGAESAAESAGGPAHAQAIADSHSHSHSHFPHEAGSADCRLVDQLAHADALFAVASLPPVLPRAAATGAATTLLPLPAGSAAAYLARGPPAGDSARISARA